MNWDAAEKKVTIEYNNSTIELIQGQYGNYGVSIDGKETGVYPSLLNNYRFDQINTLPMTFQVASNAQISINDFSAIDYKVEAAKFEELVKRISSNRYCYLSIEDTDVVEIKCIFIP